MGGWMDEWMGGRAGLRIAYSNKKSANNKPVIPSSSYVRKQYGIQLERPEILPKLAASKNVMSSTNV